MGTDLRPPDLASLTDHDVRAETAVHDDRDHCSTGIEGRSVVAARDDDERLLLLVNRDHGVALLPHGEVDAGDDWAAAAREGVAGQTGIEVALESVAAVSAVDHVVEGEATPHATTHRVVFEASRAGGDLIDCKRSADAGSDAWVAGWYDDLPEGVAPPEGRAGDDVRLVL